MSAKSNKKKRAALAKSAVKAIPRRSEDEISGIPPADVLQNGTDGFYEEYYTAAKPCVLPGVASSWPACQEWNWTELQALLSKEGPKGGPLDVVSYVSDVGAYELQRFPDLPEFLAYLDYTSTMGGCTGRSANKTHCVALRRYGLDIPRKTVAKSCPVPQFLQELHCQRKLRLRDLLGRASVKLYPSVAGPFGPCRINSMGHAAFYVQVKGSSTWLLYGPDALPLRRSSPLSDSVPEDFNSAEVRAKYSGSVVHLQPGDMLFLPPYTSYAMRSNEPWNVTVDFLCMPDEVWAAASCSPAAMGENASLLAGRALLCYSLPSMLPDEGTVRQVQEGLLGATFSTDASLLVRILVERGGGLPEGLRAAPLCASGTSLAEILLECGIHCEASFSSPLNCLTGLALLAFQQHSKGPTAMQELVTNVTSLEAAAWSTLTSREASVLADKPGERESFVSAAKEAVSTASRWWLGSSYDASGSPPAPSQGRKSRRPGGSAERKVEQIVLKLAASLDSMLAAARGEIPLEPPAAPEHTSESSGSPTSTGSAKDEASLISTEESAALAASKGSPPGNLQTTGRPSPADSPQQPSAMSSYGSYVFAGAVVMGAAAAASMAYLRLSQRSS